MSVAGSCETPPCDYCWLGTPTENNCPTAWNGTGDGCDCGCQFIDPDCSGCAPECDYCWLGTPYEKNCSLDWLDDGECDCGCQFTDVLDCCREACDDGSACTTDSCEISNGVPEGYVCTHILLPGYCLIGGHCYADGQRQVFEPCQTCDSAEQPNDWTPLPKGSSCDALINGDSCGPRCDYCWLGTPYENNCSVQWLDDGDCDCGCQFVDSDCGAQCLINGMCDEFGTCQLEPHDALCDDDAFCNGTETCDPFDGCQSGTPLTCNDNIPCTVDSCDESGDRCVHTPSHSACSDGLYCNGAERCIPGVGCRPGPWPCTPSACNEATDRCRGGANPSLRSGLRTPGVKEP